MVSMTAYLYKADERDPPWSDEKPEAMKGIEDVPGTGSADDGIVKPHEQKLYSWMDHKIEFVSSAWDPQGPKRRHGVHNSFEL